MKTLVTHINPHLDDIAAIWLFKKYHPEFKESSVEFISASEGNKGAEENEDKIFLGVGRGRFDEHKGDLEDCAASLVYKFLRSESLLPQDEAKVKALDELVEWVRLGDLGKLKVEQYEDFTVPVFIRNFGGTNPQPSLENTDLGIKILDRILKGLEEKHLALKDWEQKKIEVQTKWGRGYAIESSYVSRGFARTQEGDLFLLVDPKYNSVQFFTPKEIDLEPIYQKAKELDPSASWFLHQSHHMVICGSGSAPDSVKTKLSFKELVNVLQINS